MDRDKECSDTELIECAVCGKVLNGLDLWITDEVICRLMCDDCHKKYQEETDDL